MKLKDRQSNTACQDYLYWKRKFRKHDDYIGYQIFKIFKSQIDGEGVGSEKFIKSNYYFYDQNLVICYKSACKRVL